VHAALQAAQVLALPLMQQEAQLEPLGAHLQVVPDAMPLLLQMRRGEFPWRSRRRSLAVSPPVRRLDGPGGRGGARGRR